MQTSRRSFLLALGSAAVACRKQPPPKERLYVSCEVGGFIGVIVLMGIAISTQPLLFGMTRQMAGAQNAGKALSAINLAFFLGTALMQSVTGVVATIFGLPAVLLFMAAALIIGVIVFLICT